MTDVNSLFRQFEASLRMSPSTVDSVQRRYRRITWRLNQDFWGTASENQHSWYAGSYGRGTAISTSDIDIHFEFPNDLYERYWWSTVFGQNGPSNLLQQVKNSLQKTYPTTRLRGDGQVVVVDFSDGVSFEIVPIFTKDETTIIYPDTHNGGSWPQMQPKLESQAFAELSRNKPGGLKKLCRMLRAWNAKSLKLPGQALDVMAYKYWQTSEYSDEEPFWYFDLHTRHFFAYWVDQFNHNGRIEAPGSHKHIEVSLNNKELELLECYARLSRNAIYCHDPEPAQIWRSIFGDKFPAA